MVRAHQTPHTLQPALYCKHFFSNLGIWWLHDSLIWCWTLPDLYFMVLFASLAWWWPSEIIEKPRNNFLHLLSWLRTVFTTVFVPLPCDGSSARCLCPFTLRNSRASETHHFGAQEPDYDGISLSWAGAIASLLYYATVLSCAAARIGRAGLKCSLHT